MAARQIAMYLCRKLTDSAFRAVGESFGRDHSTAIFNYQQIARRAASDSAFAEWLEKMEQQIAIEAVRRNLRRLGRPRVRTGRPKSDAST
jgi:Bacterial dnaA protein helix-turn-helix